ncbi:MAG: acyltransferase [Paludibacteraceae bacterium]|nr:acyltransferase [Paludibacteraceae bacterium]
MNTTKQIPENKQKRTPKIEGLDFVRSFCAIGIVIYHFYCHSSFNEGFMVQNASSRWGDLFVYVFFIVSGLCIYKSNPEVQLTKFYYKRWRSIFPAFYVAYLACLMLRLAVMPDDNSDVTTPQYWTVLLTVTGLDGYFLYCIPDFYLLGEWFLGAIILLYALYPLVLRLFKKNAELMLLCLLVLSFFVSKSGFFVVAEERNVICCLTGFVIGMLMGKNVALLSDKRVVLFSFVLTVFLIICPALSFLPVIITTLLMSTTLFITLKYIGGYFSCRKMSALSYPIFLVQHMVILVLYKFVNTDNFYVSLVLCLLAIALTVFTAYVLKAVTEKITSMRAFDRLDRYMGYKRNRSAEEAGREDQG